MQNGSSDMYSASAKLDYRFVVQAIRSHSSFLSSVATYIWYISHFYHATPNNTTPRSVYAGFSLVARITVIALLYSHVQLALPCVFAFLYIYLFICIFASIVLMISSPMPKKTQTTANIDEKTRIKIIIWFRFVTHFSLLFTCSLLAVLLDARCRLFRVFVSRAFSFHFYCCSFRFRVFLFLASFRLDSIESFCLSGESTVWIGTTFAGNCVLAESEREPLEKELCTAIPSHPYPFPPLSFLS